MSVDQQFLTALRLAATLASTNRLQSERVRAVGGALGLDEQGIVDRIEALAARGALTLRWGGVVELVTPRGNAAASAIQIGDVSGNVVVGSPGATAGHGAVGAGAQVNVKRSRDQALVALAAGLIELRAKVAELDASAARKVDELATQVQATLAAAKEPSPSKATLLEGVKKGRALTDEAVKITGNITKLEPTLDLLKGGYDLLSGWIGSLV